MADAFIGEIRLLPYTFAPQGWLLCNGQLVSVQQYQALFALLNNRFGGDGRATFGLPNLQGFIPVHFGQMTGGSKYQFAKTVGAATITLNNGQVPSHTHTLNARVGSSGVTGLTGVAQTGAVSMLSRALTAANLAIDAFDKPPISNTPTTIGMQISPSGGNAGQGIDPHPNMMPYLATNFCICWDGFWPPNPNN